MSFVPSPFMHEFWLTSNYGSCKHNSSRISGLVNIAWQSVAIASCMAWGGQHNTHSQGLCWFGNASSWQVNKRLKLCTHARDCIHALPSSTWQTSKHVDNRSKWCFPQHRIRDEQDSLCTLRSKSHGLATKRHSADGTDLQTSNAMYPGHPDVTILAQAKSMSDLNDVHPRVSVCNYVGSKALSHN